MAERGAATDVGSLLGIDEDVVLTVLLGVLTAVFSGSGVVVVGFVGELAGFHICEYFLSGFDKGMQRAASLVPVAALLAN